MNTETEIKLKGMKALTTALGYYEAEKFIALMAREPFDYTDWQRELFPGQDVSAVSKAAMVARRHKRR
ncbi:MAG: hypothetical protein A2350_02490 [Candidatus Raymondbacteria bacterium RifOxyB12_full_50_8]|nr:MAG: hypothetical protein A2350_02490 [Candidatus Raymondbacteria bacterium RifOxyB12_full_50_8]